MGTLELMNYSLWLVSKTNGTDLYAIVYVIIIIIIMQFTATFNVMANAPLYDKFLKIFTPYQKGFQYCF